MAKNKKPEWRINYIPEVVGKSYLVFRNVKTNFRLKYGCNFTGVITEKRVIDAINHCNKFMEDHANEIKQPESMEKLSSSQIQNYNDFLLLKYHNQGLNNAT